MDEIAANCEALKTLRRRGLTQEQEQFIAEFHSSIGPLPAQYRGSGSAFWEATVEECDG
jgi:hypothetical protein